MVQLSLDSVPLSVNTLHSQVALILLKWFLYEEHNKGDSVDEDQEKRAMDVTAVMYNVYRTTKANMWRINRIRNHVN